METTTDAQPITTTLVCKYKLDLNVTQQAQIETSFDAARAGWNWALAAFNTYQTVLDAEVQDLAILETGGDADLIRALKADKDWRKKTYKKARETLGKQLSAVDLSKAFTTTEHDPDSPWAWFWAIDKKTRPSRRAVVTEFGAVDTAIKRYKSGISLRAKAGKKPRKDGRPHGWPRFKSRHETKQGFSDYITRKDMIDGQHRINVPKLGSLRIFGTNKRLAALIMKGGIPKTVRITRDGTGYWIAINVTVPLDMAVKDYSGSMTLRPVGVDVGVSRKLTTSDSAFMAPNPRWAERDRKRVERIQRRMATMQGPDSEGGPSQNWLTEKKRLAKVLAKQAQRRQSHTHQVTKRLATRYATLYIEDLNVAGMLDKPVPVPDGKGGYAENGAKVEAIFNRALADAAPYETRRQLEYKTGRYGSNLHMVNPLDRTATTCHKCGETQPDLKPSVRIWACPTCGIELDRNTNSAKTILAKGLAS